MDYFILPSDQEDESNSQKIIQEAEMGDSETDSRPPDIDMFNEVEDNLLENNGTCIQHIDLLQKN